VTLQTYGEASVLAVPVWVAFVPAAIARVAFVPAATGRPGSELAAIVVVPTVTVGAPMLTVVVPMATVPGVRRRRGPRSGLRQLALRPRTITATNAATIPIHRATSLTRKAPDHISRFGRLTKSDPPALPGDLLSNM